MATSPQRSEASGGLVIQPPHGALAPFISHYWLGLDNRDPVYTARPDGCVDLVFEATATDWRGWAYGTTTRPTDIPCRLSRHYLGIRFRPGQSRHFLRARACELTDCRAEVAGLLAFPAEAIAALIATGDVFSELDRGLLASLDAASPETTYVDHAVRFIEAAHGDVRVEQVATALGWSRRQLERSFLATVGIPLKFYAMLARLHRAMALVALQPRPALADIAASSGYADQSHMTREFTRLIGMPPGRHLRGNVAFLQD